jgi:soluble lytic murein transglycosylase-like protein
LLQVGQPQRAEAELRLLWPEVRNTPPLARAVMLVAERAGLYDLAAQLADLLQASDGRPREATRFRVPRLRPEGGFRVDPALVYALARTESNFDTTMVSPAGARGILQILPETASFITAGNRGDSESRTARLSHDLHDPSVNLDVGQRYVSYLSAHGAIDGDLIRLLVAYNAGPGNLIRWQAGILDMGDPFMFIEAIPSDETRAFVPRVLAYTWIFADRLHLPTPSLTDLAHGDWPRYRPLMEQVSQVLH